MSDPKLVRMANNIAVFFQSYPEDKAVAGVHDHIRSFWTPKMCAALRAVVAGGAEGVHPLVIEAMTHESHAANPAGKEAAGPAELGQIGASDAG